MQIINHFLHYSVFNVNMLLEENDTNLCLNTLLNIRIQN